MPRKLIKPLNSPSSGSSFPPLAPTQPQPPSTLSDLQALPRLIVFDLDYTLWPFWVDTHCTPPLKASPAHTACVDKYGESFSFYEDVPSVLLSLKERGVKLGLASRTTTPELAREMLKLLHLPPLEDAGPGGRARRALEVFDYIEVYPGSKINHFERIRKTSAVEYEQMLFFDDEVRNRNVESLGVTMYLVRDGVSSGEVDEGVWEWRKRRGIPRVPESGSAER